MHTLFFYIDALKPYIPLVFVIIILIYIVKYKWLNDSIRTAETMYSISKYLGLHYRKIFYAVLSYSGDQKEGVSDILEKFTNGFNRIVFNDQIDEEQRANQLVYYIDNEYRPEFDCFLSDYFKKFDGSA